MRKFEKDLKLSRNRKIPMLPSREIAIVIGHSEAVLLLDEIAKSFFLSEVADC